MILGRYPTVRELAETVYRLRHGPEHRFITALETLEARAEAYKADRDRAVAANEHFLDLGTRWQQRALAAEAKLNPSNPPEGRPMREAYTDGPR